jgi:hypothetical protein
VSIDQFLFARGDFAFSYRRNHMGRILIVHGNDVIEPEPDPPLLAPGLAMRQRAVLLELRLEALQKAPVANLTRTHLLRIATIALNDGDHDTADAVMSLIIARDATMTGVVAAWLQEALIEFGQHGMYQARCRECGCTDEAACPGGCEWIEAGLCSRCAGTLLDARGVGMLGGAP